MTPTIGQMWLDKDKRSLGGNRRVVIRLVAFGTVTYEQVVGSNDKPCGQFYRSRQERFVKAFRFIK